MSKYKVCLYCQIGNSLDLAKFAIPNALQNSGLSADEVKIVFITWKTAPEVFDWLAQNNFEHRGMTYDEGKGFLHNLYKGWNFGYEIGYQYADYVCPIATDHAFYVDWLKNLMKYARPNRIVNCKLIEPGTLPTLHTTQNFGITTHADFNMKAFMDYCQTIWRDELIMSGQQYGHRLDAMPFVCPKDVWGQFGPMRQDLNPMGITGDTDFFDRCMAGGVEITKSLSGISYHCGGLETRKNEAKGVYT